jgi:outer membrane protein OmpA-like peptidoglycan-associated protein
LVKKGGVDGRQLAAKGWGKSKPVAPNTKPDGSDNPEGRQKNRRVEVTVKKQ